MAIIGCTNSRGRAAIATLAVIAALGCPSAGKGPVVEPAPPKAPPPALEVPPPLPPSPPPPSEADLAIQAAREAEAAGDHKTAVETYEKAAALPLENSRLADIQYSLALLHADPNNAGRSLDQSRAALQSFLGSSLHHPRAREARVMVALMEEMLQMQVQSETVQVDLDTVTAELAALKTRLEEKEKELEGIKKVLLQTRKKP